jgi:hypothetical protein
MDHRAGSDINGRQELQRGGVDSFTKAVQCVADKAPMGEEIGC